MPTEYGDSVRARRQAAGLTQKQLALLAGTTQQYLSLIERGGVDPRSGTCQRIDKELNPNRLAA